jgi:hypothetical protein
VIIFLDLQLGVQVPDEMTMVCASVKKTNLPKRNKKGGGGVERTSRAGTMPLAGDSEVVKKRRMK